MEYMFKDCKLISRFPEIDKWRTHEDIKINGMFYNCKNWVTLPELKIKIEQNPIDVYSESSENDNDSELSIISSEESIISNISSKNSLNENKNYGNEKVEEINENIIKEENEFIFYENFYY